MAEVRRQEFVVSLADIASNPTKVLAANEFLYVRQADGKLKMMCGDGVTAISALPYTIDIGAMEQAVIDAQAAQGKAEAAQGKAENAQIVGEAQSGTLGSLVDNTKDFTGLNLVGKTVGIVIGDKTYYRDILDATGDTLTFSPLPVAVEVSAGTIYSVWMEGSVAEAIPIIDADGNFTGEDVESALKELAEKPLPNSDLIAFSDASGNIAATNVEGALTEIGNGITHINVKNYGAVGDGVTDDKAAIVAALTYAKEHLPAEVYFPKGDYGLLTGGIYLTLPLGSSGLTIRGDGARLSRIKYLEAWEPAGSWVALRIQPASTPANDLEYLHDIIIKDIGVFDTDPVGHAWNVADGDPATEETHGFDINYTINAQYLNCGIWSVGDEALDMVFCKDSVISNCYVYNSPGAGASGGAISVGDGCSDVRVVNNVIVSSIATKNNFGIAVECLNVANPVKNVIISNNTISKITGKGINIGAAGGLISNVICSGNTISECSIGVGVLGAGGVSGLTLDSNTVTNGESAVYANTSNVKGLQISNLRADAMSGLCIHAGGFVNSFIKNSILTNLQTTAIYFSGSNMTIDGILIDGVGLATGIATGAIQQHSTTTGAVVRNTKILNCKTTKGIQDVETIINTSINMDFISGVQALTNVKYVYGGVFNGMIAGVKSGAIIKGVTIYMESDPGNHGVVLADKSDCIISECNITIPNRYGIRETGSADYNIIVNNNVRNCTAGTGIDKIGTNTILANNQLRSV